MNKNKGFTLIEVLIAVVILAVGLLGLAGLQVTSLRNNQSASTRSQATQLAYDLADRMRANKPGVATYTAILPGNATAKPNCLTATGCPLADTAINDLYEWNKAVQDTLPSGAGALAVAAGVFTITINWDDDRDGDVDGNDPSFQTSFQL